MSIFNDKALKSVADAVSKVLTQESSHGTEPKDEKEKKLAALAHPKDKVTHKDVLVGRGVLKKEEAENLNELKKSTLGSYVRKAMQDREDSVSASSFRSGEAGDKYNTSDETRPEANRAKGINRALNKLTKEDAETVEEGWDDMQKAVKEKTAPKPSGGSGVKQGSRYGGAKQKPVKESFSTLIQSYVDGGLKSLSENLHVEEEVLEEEPDNAQFTKELEDQKASMEGKKKQPSVAAPATQGVKTMPEEVEVQDEELEESSKYAKMFNKAVKRKEEKEKKEKPAQPQKMKEEVELEERSLTPGEKKEMEKNVKGMKKKLSGFKQRYGDRAKEVMYATATKMAKKD